MFFSRSIFCYIFRYMIIYYDAVYDKNMFFLLCNKQVSHFWGKKKLSKLIAFNVKYTRLFNSGRIYGEHVQWQLEILYSESSWKENLFFIRFVVSQAVNIKMWDFETRKKENLTSGYIYNGDMTEKAVAVETIILVAYVNRIK